MTKLKDFIANFIIEYSMNLPHRFESLNEQSRIKYFCMRSNPFTSVVIYQVMHFGIWEDCNWQDIKLVQIGRGYTVWMLNIRCEKNNHVRIDLLSFRFSLIVRFILNTQSLSILNPQCQSLNYQCFYCIIQLNQIFEILFNKNKKSEERISSSIFYYFLELA